MSPITKNLFSLIWYFVRPYRWRFFAMAFFRISSVVLESVVVNYTIRSLLEQLGKWSDDRTNIVLSVKWHLLAFFMVLVAIELLFRLYDYMHVKILPPFQANLRMWVVRYLQDHSYQFFTQHFSGDLVKRVDDLTYGVAEIVIMAVGSFCPTFCAIFAGVLCFFYIQPVFGSILMAWLTLHIIAYFVYVKRFNHPMMVHAEKIARLCGSMGDGFSNILSIKLFARNSHAIAHLSVPQEAEKEAHQKALSTIAYFHCVVSGLFMLCIGIGLTLSVVYYWKLNKITISDATYVFFTAISLCNAVWETVALFPDFFEEIGDCQQVLKLLQQKYTVVDKPMASLLQCQSATIEFKNVSFSYGNPYNFIDNQSIKINSGEKVGLVGLSGSGKTTFVHLLLRFFDPQSGSIAINGQDIATVTQESLRAAIAFISQDPMLFHATILENIRYGFMEATDHQVMVAAQAAKCHNFIIHLPKGYQTVVGERGAQLSGGQRQRIAIARAILKNAPILILDEATAALDTITEMEIQESLGAVMAGKTVIVIAHRLSVLRTMDRILLLDQGKIVADGPHALLIKTSALYATMYRLYTQTSHE